MVLALINLFLLGVSCSVGGAEDPIQVETAQIPVEVIDSNSMLTPIDQTLNHPFEGSYIDQVVGNDQLYRCEPEVVFVVDMSTSVGAANIASQTIPLMESVLTSLNSLPKGDPSPQFKHNVSVVTFNKKATVHTIQLKGEELEDVFSNLGKVLTDADVKGGSCISCGLELAAETLAKVPGLRNKFIILVSDGHDHDALNSNSKTPGEVSSYNRNNQIFHFSVAVSGVQKVPYNEEQLTQIAETPTEESYFFADTKGRISSASLNIVDMIAGRSCMEIYDETSHV